jgi:hypothetical protein
MTFPCRDRHLSAAGHCHAHPAWKTPPVPLTPPNDAGFTDALVFPGLYQYVVCFDYQDGMYQSDQTCEAAAAQMPFPFRH